MAARAKRWLRRLGIALVGPLVLSFAALFVLTELPSGRAWITRKALDYVERELALQIRVDETPRLDPWGVELRGVTLRMRDPALSAHVDRVSARLRPLALLRNSLHFTALELQGVRGELADLGRLLAGGKPGGTQAPAKKPAQRSTFRVRVDRLRLRDAVLDTRLEGQALRADIERIQARGVYGPTPQLVLQKLSLSLARQGVVALRLGPVQGSFHASKGGVLKLRGELGGSPLVAAATLRPLRAWQPWPLARASLRVGAIDRDTLGTLGAEAQALAVQVHLGAVLMTEGERAIAAARLEADRSSLDLKLQWTSARAELAARLSPTSLAAVYRGLPKLMAEGNLVLTAPASLKPLWVELAWTDVRLEHQRIPDGEARASRAGALLRLEHLTLRGMEDQLTLAGTYHTGTGTGSLDLTLRRFQLTTLASLLDAQLGGSVNAQVHLRHAAAGTIDGALKLSVAGFRVAEARAEQLELRLGLGGTLRAPEGTFQLAGERVRWTRLELEHAAAQGRLDARRLRAGLLLEGRNTALRVTLGGTRDHAGSLRLQAIGRGSLIGHPLDFDLRELRYAAGAISLGQLELRSGEARVRLRGRKDARGQIAARLDASAVELAPWGDLLQIEGLAGRGSGYVELEGRLAAPRAHAELSVLDLQVEGQAPIDMLAIARADLPARALNAKLSAFGGDGLELRAALVLALPQRPRDLSRALEQGEYAASLVANVPIERLVPASSDPSRAVHGELTAELTAGGSLLAPKVQATLQGRVGLGPDPRDVHDQLSADLELDDQAASLNLILHDRIGDLLTLKGALRFPARGVLGLIERPELLGESDFSLNGRLAPRRFDKLDGVYEDAARRFGFALPLEAGGMLELSSRSSQLVGTLRARATLLADRLDTRCVPGARTGLALDAQLAGNAVDSTLSMRVSASGDVRADLHMPFDPLAALSGRGTPWGPASLQAQGQQVDLSRVPGLCGLRGGRAVFSLDAQELGSAAPDVRLALQVDEVGSEKTTPVSIAASASAGRDKATLNARLRLDDGASGSLEAELPLLYHGALPALAADRPWHAHARLIEVPVAPIAAFTGALGRVRGSITTDLKVDGSLAAPKPAGFVVLHDVSFSIAALAQPIRSLSGRIDIDDHNLTLRDLSARDRTGKLRAEGKAKLAPNGPGQGELHLEADRLPLRQQGLVVGELTLRSDLEAHLARDLALTLDVKISEASLWLTGERGKNVQSLDPHPDVRFAEAPPEPPEPSQPAAVPEKKGLRVEALRVRSTRDLWVRHQDFSVQLGVAIALRSAPEPRLEGVAEIRRGHLTLLSKAFDIERGSVRFTGDTPPDPELDLKATYQPPAGEKLTVQVTGPTSSPNVSFSGAANSPEEAVAVLTGVGARTGTGDAASNAAQADARNFALGLTAGLLTMTARRNLGDWVPVIAVESDVTGAPTRARAGFDATRLIPRRLQRIARGAYVEGIVGETGETQGGNVGFGMRLEIALPRDFITSMGYGPGTAWGADVNWVP